MFHVKRYVQLYLVRSPDISVSQYWLASTEER